jgi:LemA protein
MSALKKFSWLWAILGILVLLGIWAISSYNSLVTARAAVDADWAQVETQYQRRFDLIPNLVSTVEGSADFEQDTLVQVTQARTQFLGAGSRDEQVAAANEFDSALSLLLVTVEAYPQIQSTKAFTDLMTQLEGTENRIATARRDYNEEVQRYNVQVLRFPGSIFAAVFGFDALESFKSAEGAETAPEVNFDDAE